MSGRERNMESLAKAPLPSSNEAERAVLGSILIENSSMNHVAEMLVPEDFHNENHSKILSSMMELYKKDSPIDVLTLYEWMDSEGTVEDVGGAAYLAYLTSTVPTARNVRHYAQIVKNKSVLRKLILAGTDIAHRGHGADLDVDEFLDRAEQSIFEIAQDKIKRSFWHSKDLAPEAIENIRRLHDRKELITGVRTGFEKLDHMTSGLQNSDLVIVAARPGAGKTSLCLNVISNVALGEGLSVGMFSLEMTKEQLMLRLLSINSKVSFSAMRSGHMRDEELDRLFDSAERYSGADIFIDDTPALTVMEIRAKARRLKKDNSLDLLIVDYLQLMRGGGSRNESREREIAEISGSLKALAKELSIPVIAISQLSRQTETRTDRRPQLADLRESGAIEQDADVVLFIHRQDIYRKDPEEKDGTAELIIGKQRNGPQGVVKLVFLERNGVPSFENPSDEFEEGFV